jgi:hypothetical protein
MHVEGDQRGRSTCKIKDWQRDFKQLTAQD